MTLGELQAMLAGIDPDIRHGWTMANGRDYTYWEEKDRLTLRGDDHAVESDWVFYVHRFSRANIDPVAEALWAALEALPNVAVHQVNTYEPDTGYTHHAFRCEVV